MMTHQLASTLVADHARSLERAAAVHRLRRRAVGAEVRTSAPAARRSLSIERAARRSAPVAPSV